MKKCPECKEDLEQALFYEVKVDYCPLCLGVFFEREELDLIKDNKDKLLRWKDLKIFEEDLLSEAKVSYKSCPHCRLNLYQVLYPAEVLTSERELKENISLEVCKVCQGMWLERGEFKALTELLKQQAWGELNSQKVELLLKEFWEFFIGPKPFREEVGDVVSLLKLLAYKKEDILKKIS